MNIIKYIKNIIEINNDDLSFLNVGDIIWAKRYKNENQKNKIEKGHQESPYIIIKKYKNKVFALQCTSNPHQEIGWKILYYPLNRLQYNLDKNTYVGIRIVHELKNIQYVEKIGHLNDYDINKIKKYLFILKTSNYKSKPNIENKYINFKYEIGDIIIFNDTKYYIEDIKFGYYITYRLRKRVKVDNNIIINNTYYSFIFEKQEKIKKSKNILLVDTFNTGEIKKINQYKISYLDSLNNKRNIKRILDIGVLVKYNNNLFYIYDKNEISYFAYRIYLSTEYKIGMLWLKINGGIFYTFLDRVELSKEKLETVGYKIKRQSTKEEIEDNSISFNILKKKRNSLILKKSIN